MVFLANSYPRSVGLHLINVWNPFSVMRYMAILSISCGGHPWSVEMVTELQISPEIPSISSFVTCSNRSACSKRYALQDLNTSESCACFIVFKKLSIFSDWMPARSYPTLILNWKPSILPKPYSLAITLQRNHALMYSSMASGTYSSVDHSQL